MINKLSGWDDTIVAPATASGVGAICIIRLSGPESFQIAARLFPSKNLLSQASHTLHVGILSHAGNAIDEVVVSLYKSPKSYTGEDIVEISCHGSPYIQEQVMLACVKEGARLARPGEFTQRAFLNGKLDLVQAEAVADLIASNSGASQKTALQNIRGGFSKALSEMREQLIKFSALIELELDFAEEDVAFADRTKFYELIKALQQQCEQLMESFKLGNVIKNGVNVAIIGKPNAGKSTLLNTLLNEERAIVSPIAGTTRDTIEETLNIHGILFRLIDTAGIREHSSDLVENIGIDKSLEKMASADIVLYLFDVQHEDKNSIAMQEKIFKEKGISYILVGNKTDITPEHPFTEKENLILVSAKSKTGIDKLKLSLYNHTIAAGESFDDKTIVTNARHYEALQNLSASLSDIHEAMDKQLSGDLMATDIRRSLYYLGEITGEITNEDKLDYIFSKFCIGK
jgi:tRNA modification GTPase